MSDDERSAEAHPYGFDPYTDWAAHRRKEMAEAGFTLADDASNDAVARVWLNLLRRAIEPKPRTVLRARSFSPMPEEAAAVDKIERRAQAGLDLNRYLHEPRKINERDGLLFDWDLHHFHLGLVLEASGYVKRGDRLLFARVTGESVYMIAIGDHDSWADQALFDAMHANWPETLERSRLSVLPPEPGEGFTDDERDKLRKAGVQTFTCTADGAVYFSPGGGIATDRSNLKVTNDRTCLRSYFRYLVDHVRRTKDSIREKAWAAGINPATLRLRLVFDEAEQPVAQDEAAGFGFLLPTFDTWQKIEREAEERRR